MDECQETLLSISENNLNAVAKKHNDIDTKAIGIITISGILISFLIGSTSEKSFVSYFSFFLTSLSFLITVYLCVLVLKPRDDRSSTGCPWSLGDHNQIGHFQIPGGHTDCMERIAHGRPGTARTNRAGFDRDTCN